MTAQLLVHLHTALELLEISPTSPLAIDLHTAIKRMNRSAYQIAVFGDFNHGKSTLLNAILGSKALPIDLIPTTGGAIKVIYGAEITTTITLTSGQIINQSGTHLLDEFAILDDDRRMRSDVVNIEVSYPHPLLEMGVELIDLPGTNDREEQDCLIQAQLLAADLVVYVLDTRKLMTLGERERLRDWLEQRGINTVIFVANFTNMLEPTECQEIQNRLRFVAESFRSALPAGVSNLYRVDALPALRARLKGDDHLLHTSGLPTFMAALQTIFHHQSAEIDHLPAQILQSMVGQVANLLQIEIFRLTSEIATLSTKHLQEITLKQQAKKLIQAGWHQSLQGLEEWLHLPTLLHTYQKNLSVAIQQNNFIAWEQSNIALKLQGYQTEVNDWLLKLAQFFDVSPANSLLLSCPAAPEVELLPPTATSPAAGRDLTLPQLLLVWAGSWVDRWGRRWWAALVSW
jgi:hypothetical protein